MRRIALFEFQMVDKGLYGFLQKKIDFQAQ
jgi:hypothetical protein